METKKFITMKPTRYAVEELRTSNRTEYETEASAIRHYEKLRKNNISCWIVNIFE